MMQALLGDMPKHGGRIKDASETFGIAVGNWLDLSTGNNMRPRPVGRLPDQCWSRLPEEDDGLETAAAEYYGSGDCLPVAGSQSAIQLLPQLRQPCSVAVVSPTYSEHAFRWQEAGHKVHRSSADLIGSTLAAYDVVVVCNPNNPDGRSYSSAMLRQWHERLACRGGWLIVDEGYRDLDPSLSLIEPIMPGGLIILRSMSKLFGLGGVRVGFVLAQKALLAAIKRRVGPWAITHPSRLITMHALSDLAWQQSAIAQVKTDARRMTGLLRLHGLDASAGGGLFCWAADANARLWADFLAEQGILVRYYSSGLDGQCLQYAGLRVGYPATEKDWQRFELGLAAAAVKICSQRRQVATG